MIDAWSGPTPISNQFPANEPNGIRKLLDKIKAVELQAKESTSNLLRTAGIYLSPTGMTIDSSLAVTGDLATTGHTTIGGVDVVANLVAQQATLTAQQATLAANLASINDLLTQVVKPQAVWALAQGFALPTSNVVVLTRTAIVPAGFTKAVVSVVGRLFATNPNGSYDYLTALTRINGTGGAQLPTLVGASGGSGISVSPYSTVLTGLTPGGTFFIDVMSVAVWTAWAANPNNTVELSGSIQWYR